MVYLGSFELDSHDFRQFSSSNMNYIKNFNIKFENIPMMTVIAGVNGIGKTTLLKALEAKLRNNEILHLYISNNSYIQLGNLKQQHEQNIHNITLKLQEYVLKRITKDFVKEQEYEAYVERMNVIQKNSTDIYDFYKHVVNEMNPSNPIFKLHYTNYVEQLEISTDPPEEFEKRINELNKFLEKEKFRYKIKFIKGRKYDIILFDKHGTFRFDSLSDGEKILMTSLFWKFEKYPAINEEIVLLLDEPDCHLHPGAVKQLIEAIQNLASKMKIQIIMTTHNPITLNFVYDDSLYVMNFTDDTQNEISIIKASQSKIHPSTLLTND